jgi:oxygen-independent coproporphyrinogen-3 oxidase
MNTAQSDQKHLYGELHPDFKKPRVLDLLEDEINNDLLKYVQEDPFGCHRFPGDIPTSDTKAIIRNMRSSLEKRVPFHLWLNLPFCLYHCHYCQFPVWRVRHHSDNKIDAYINLLIKEMKLWVQSVPELKEVPIGELNLFGGTPSLLNQAQLECIFSQIHHHFKLDQQTTIRVEGSPETLDYAKLSILKNLGVQKISYGIQSFSDGILAASGRKHTVKQAINTYYAIRKLGFMRVNGDLIYGLPSQTPHHFLADVKKMIGLGFDAIVIAKLHLRSFSDTKTAVSGIKPAVWQLSKARKQVKNKGYFWPSIGYQYQMREEANILLQTHGYYECPTMYFNRKSLEPEKWKSIVLDPDKSAIELGLGTGSSSAISDYEWSSAVDLVSYSHLINRFELPIFEATHFSLLGRYLRYFSMQLSRCTPLLRNRFCTHDMLTLYSILHSQLLTRRLIRPYEKALILTDEGKTLVEAIINTIVPKLKLSEGAKY